ncbi:hypothetical protein [Nocardia sp. CS682]|uniref:hypothetical protein n=1 Tax=Nocardia sp. CS682 TaxID=1047172 RepID=UPI0010754746|nr:hypothetical protein [Nocardia sp. CS682]QBS41996.1 hypothetical protein DMB37_19505 [Nocardia sp. CS682]
MTTENAVNSEPTVVYEDDIMITMRGVADSIGLPYTVNPFELVDREALIELREGNQGAVGPEGEAAWPWSWQGDVADVAALNQLKLTTADARKAWRVVADNSIYYWTGMGFIAFGEAFRAPGSRGASNQLTGVAVAGPTGSAAAARVTGTSPAQQVEITFPRGETGDVGDPGAKGRIQDASDVLIDSERSLGQDHVLAWDAATQKFRPIPSPRPSGPWVIGQKQFTTAKNVTDPIRTLAAITIPSQPTAWRPLVEGGVQVQTEQPTRCDIEVRIGSPTGERVGYGWSHRVSRIAYVLVSPGFQYPTKPGATYGIVPANQTITLYVVAQRAEGTGSYNIDSNYSHIHVRALPV